MQEATELLKSVRALRAEPQLSLESTEELLEKIRADRDANETPQSTVDDVSNQIQAIAMAKVREDPDLTIAQARADAWRENPDLVDASRRLPTQKGAETDTIGDRIRYVIDDATRRSSWKPILDQWGSAKGPDRIRSEVRAALWETPDGEALRDLDRAVGGETYSARSVREIGKSSVGRRHAHALSLLENGMRIA